MAANIEILTEIKSRFTHNGRWFQVKGVYVFVYLLFLFAAAMMIYYHYLQPPCRVCPIKIASPSFELANRFLIAPDSSILFSANEGNYFTLYRYKNNNVRIINALDSNVFSPFLFSGHIAGLQDKNGDEKFQPTSEQLKKIIDKDNIESIFSFKNGSIIVYELKDSRAVYLLDLPQGKKRLMVRVESEFNGCDYSSDKNSVLLSYDNELVYFQLSNDKEIFLSGLPAGPKLNPSISGNFVYFSNNYDAEFYQIYRVNITGDSGATVICKSLNDLRMPKVRGESLYFIEVSKSEYLLRRMDLSSGKVQAITKKGVVYNYEFYVKDQIIFTYSDFFAPPSLICYSPSDSLFENLTAVNVRHGLSIKYVDDGKSSPAYVISPPSSFTTLQGVILYFHPGLHSDFSPRWDDILINLSLNGYVIIVPNYPMSIGYGKNHYAASVSQAINDMNVWKKFILDSYDLPLYFLSSSSGNILMEELLFQDNAGVAAAGCLFGTYYINREISVPTLFVLGENDPIVGFNERRSFLEQTRQSADVSILSYRNEGHWLRSSENRADVLKRLIQYFCCH